MSLNRADLHRLITHELERITDPAVRKSIEDLLVKPHCVVRDWDYGEEGETYPCWTVLEHPASNTCIAYCASGFGPRDCWGLLHMSGEYMSMGMDSQWFTTLEDAFRNSGLWDGENPPGYEVA